MSRTEPFQLGHQSLPTVSHELTFHRDFRHGQGPSASQIQFSLTNLLKDVPLALLEEAPLEASVPTSVSCYYPQFTQRSQCLLKGGFASVPVEIFKRLDEMSSGDR